VLHRERNRTGRAARNTPRQPADRLESAVGEIVKRETQGIARLVDRFVAGTIQLF
jgi:hypothetical protein